MVPSPAAWLLPEFRDLSSQLTVTLDLPALVPHGLATEPTGDGFLIWLPARAPVRRCLRSVAGPAHLAAQADRRLQAALVVWRRAARQARCQTYEQVAT